MSASGYTSNPPGSGGGGSGAVDSVNGRTGAVVLTKTDVGLGNVTNTSDAAKPVSAAQQTALDLKANLAGPTFTGTVAGITKAMVGLGSVDNTSDASKPISTAEQTALNLKANLAGPTFTGTVAGITASMVGLGNVTNTSDAAKPVSTAQQTALDLKADLASPALTGNPTAPTQTAGNNTTRVATTAFVTAAVAAGGGGGSSMVVKRAIVSSGNITPQNTTGSWQALTGGPTLVIAAAVGNYLSVEIMAVLMTKDSATFWDLAVLNGASLVRFGSNGTGTPATEGDGSLYQDTAFPRSGTVFDFVAASGDINAGNVTICFGVKSAGAGLLHAGFYPLRWRVTNHGSVTVS